MFLKRFLAVLLAVCAMASAAAAQSSLYPSPIFNRTTTQSLTVGGTNQNFPASGNIAGTTDTQTLANKTLASPTVTGSTPLAYLSSATDQAESFLVQTSLHAYEWAFGVIGMPSIAALRANTVPWPTIHVQGWNGPGTPGGGLLELVASDTTSADNGGTIIVDVSGHRYYRQDRPHGDVFLYDFGAKCDRSTLDDTAIHNAEAYAETVGGTVIEPSGQICEVSQQIIARAIWTSFGASGTLEWNSSHDLGAGVPGFVIMDGDAAAYENLRFYGPGATIGYQVGVANANMDGVEMGQTNTTAPQAHMTSLNIQGFKHGLVINTTYGHWVLDGHNLITNNYEGIYILNGGGDNKIYNVEATGNSMAAMACPSGSQCLNGGAMIVASHFGFSPYGFLVEPGTTAGAGQGIWSDVSCIECHFESIGNSAIKVESGPYAVMDALDLRHVGFSWDDPGLNGSNYTYTLGGGATPSPISVTCTGTNGSNQLTACTTDPITDGVGFTMDITGTGVPANTFVSATAATTITMSQNFTGTTGSVTVSAFYERKYPIDIASGDLEGIMNILAGEYAFTPGTSGAIIHLGYGGSNGGCKIHMQFDGPISVYTSFATGGLGYNPILPTSATAPSLLQVDNDPYGCANASRIDVPGQPENGSVTVMIQSADTSPSYSDVPAADYANVWSSSTQTSGLHVFEAVINNASNQNSNNAICVAPSTVGDTSIGIVANSWCYQLSGNVYDNGSYVSTYDSAYGGYTIDIAVDQTDNKVWIEVLDGSGNPQGGGWDFNGTDNPATKTGGFALPSGQTFKVGLAVIPQYSQDATNGAFTFNLTGPFAYNNSLVLSSGWSTWGGAMNPSDMAPQITMAAGSNAGSATFPLNHFAFTLGGILPSCNPTSDPGQPWSIGKSLPQANQGEITVTMPSIPTNNATFECAVTLR